MLNQTLDQNENELSENQETIQTESKELALLNMIEAEFKDSKSPEEFKSKLNDIRTLIETCNKVERETSNNHAKINFNDYDAKILSVMATRTNHIMDEVEKLNDDWLDLFQVAAVETDMQKEGRDLNDKEKAVLSTASNAP